MLGDITMPMSRAAAAISAFCVGEAGGADDHAHALARQAARWASVPSGRVKSISTSAWARPWARSSVMATPLAMPSQPVASRPMAGLPRGPARRPARSRGGLHGLDQHAAHAAARTGNGDAQGEATGFTGSPAGDSCGWPPAGRCRSAPGPWAPAARRAPRRSASACARAGAGALAGDGGDELILGGQLGASMDFTVSPSNQITTERFWGSVPWRLMVKT
jgi:hypothetical protein